jgi:hypothetical protein
MPAGFQNGDIEALYIFPLPLLCLLPSGTNRAVVFGIVGLCWKRRKRICGGVGGCYIHVL